MSGATPGPWRALMQYGEVWGADDTVVAEVRLGEPEQTAANVNLITSSPLLRDALEDLIHQVEHTRQTEDVASIGLDEARAALRSARGEQGVDDAPMAAEPRCRTTHHEGCACREAKVAALVEALTDLLAESGHLLAVCEDPDLSWPIDQEDWNIDHAPALHDSWKRARAALAEWRGESDG